MLILKGTVGRHSIPVSSLDLGMSLGVLRQILDTALVIKDLSKELDLRHFCILYSINWKENPSTAAKFSRSRHDAALISLLPHRLASTLSRIIATFV